MHSVSWVALQFSCAWSREEKVAYLYGALATLDGRTASAART